MLFDKCHMDRTTRRLCLRYEGLKVYDVFHVVMKSVGDNVLSVDVVMQNL
jgi:hypothetical protein